MGTWNADGGPGGGDWFTRFGIFDDRLFAFAQSGGGNSGVWERTALATWTQRTPNGDGPGVIWRGRMFQVISLNAVWSSVDGVNWIHEYTSPGGLTIDAMNGHSGSTYLYITYRDGANIYFARRDVNGTWATVAAMTYASTNATWDVIEYGSYVYWSETGGNDIRRWTGTAWESEPTIANLQSSLFTVYNAMLFVSSATQDEVWRLSGTSWTQELDLAAIGYDIVYGHICEGDDGLLYLAAYNGGNTTRIYIRIRGQWVFQGVHNPSQGDCAIMYDGDMYFGSHWGAGGACFLYVPSFAVTGSGNGCPPQAMDCDADGNSLYVGVYNMAGQPILIKALLPLADDLIGLAVFNPADGDAINVKCIGVGEKFAISGNFAAAGNEQVQVSEDGGVSFTDIDPGTWGAETAQPLLVDPDTVDQVTVGLWTAQDLLETIDQGILWTVQNPAIGYSAVAMARLPIGDELLIGNGGGNRIDYSPNRGQQLHDITGLFQGAVAALAVV